MNLPSDAELIERIVAGERELYAVVVERYQEMLYRFAFGMLRDPDAAADLVQDSFVKAYASLTKCRDRSQFKSWIFRIVRNRCTDHLRAPAEKHAALDTDAPYLAAGDDPEVDFQRGELRREVERALATLPEAQREAFLLKHVEDLSYDEMADLLGVGVSALKMRVLRAREALQAALRRTGVSETTAL